VFLKVNLAALDNKLDRKHSLSAAQVTDLKRRIAAGERKAQVARKFGVSRETVYRYLRAPA
jgi:DNA-binding phage protein